MQRDCDHIIPSSYPSWRSQHKEFNLYQLCCHSNQTAHLWQPTATGLETQLSLSRHTMIEAEKRPGGTSGTCKERYCVDIGYHFQLPPSSLHVCGDIPIRVNACVGWKNLYSVYINNAAPYHAETWKLWWHCQQCLMCIFLHNGCLVPTYGRFTYLRYYHADSPKPF